MSLLQSQFYVFLTIAFHNRKIITRYMFENFSVCTSKYRMYEKNHKPSSIFNVQQWLYRKTYLINIPNTSFTSMKKVFIYWKPKAIKLPTIVANIHLSQLCGTVPWYLPSCEDSEDLCDCDWRNSQWLESKY